jgi:hypothetical protein
MHPYKFGGYQVFIDARICLLYNEQGDRLHCLFSQLGNSFPLFLAK